MKLPQIKVVKLKRGNFEIALQMWRWQLMSTNNQKCYISL